MFDTKNAWKTVIFTILSKKPHWCNICGKKLLTIECPSTHVIEGQLLLLFFLQEGLRYCYIFFWEGGLPKIVCTIEGGSAKIVLNRTRGEGVKNTDFYPYVLNGWFPRLLLLWVLVSKHCFAQMPVGSVKLGVSLTSDKLEDRSWVNKKNK